MATVTGLTAARMLTMESDLNARSLAVEAESIVAARLVGYDLVLTTFAGVDINVGDVRGPSGPSGTVTTDASQLISGTLADARLAVGSNAATVAAKATPSDITAALVDRALIVEASNVVAISGAAQTLPAVTVATLNVVTLSAACTFTFPAAVVGKSFSLVLVAGGAFAVTWPVSVKWSGGTAPALTTTVGKIDAFSFVSDGTNWLGFTGGKNF